MASSSAFISDRPRCNVRLSKLKLAGFKSFVDPTTVLTPGQLVGIVGPNGCGKSNLIDAVRWVLGESRASALRGESMQDVIFNGSSTRKPVSRASVELVFDNSAGRAAGQWSQYAEIAVKRLVDRAGGSDYFINNVRVRRKDVIDLFLGTGLGPRAYAIIEQGMISRVIEARPEDVRAFLEEAAGVTKYKERRRETEGRLADASENLVRVEDICSELGQQIGRLSEQAEVARRYKEINTQLRARQALLWRYRHTAAVRDLEAATAALGAATVDLEERNTRLVEVESRLLLARDGLSLHAEAVSQAQADLYAILAEVTRIEADMRRIGDNRERLTSRSNQLAGEVAAWEERLTRLAEEWERWTGAKEEASARVETARTLHAEAAASLPDAESAWKDSVAQRDQARQAVAVAEQQIRVAEARSSASQRALENHQFRSQRLADDAAALKPVEEIGLEALEAELEALNERLLVATEQYDGGHQDLDLLRNVLAQAQERVGASSRQVTERSAKLAALRSLQSRLRDQGDFAEWTKLVGLGGEPPFWQCLHVEAGWELAVEAVLRERVAAVGPLNTDLPHALLTHPAPATTMVLRNSLPEPSGRMLDVSSLAHSLPDIKPLSDLVRSSDPIQGRFLAHWLHSTYAVEDAEEVLTGHFEIPESVMIVARNGAVITAHDVTLFAPDARTHGAIERQREIESLENALALDEAALAEAEDAVYRASQDIGEREAALVTLQRTTQEYRSLIHERQLEIVRAQQEVSRFKERDSQLRREILDVGELERSEREHLEAAEAERLEGAERLASDREALDLAASRVQAAEEVLQQTRDSVSVAQRTVSEAEFALREAESKLLEISRAKDLAQTQLEKGNQELGVLAAERDGLDESSLGVSLQTALDLRHSHEAVLAQRRNEQESATQQVRELDAARLRLEHELNPLRDRIGELKLAQQAAELASAQALERLVEQGLDGSLLSAEELAEVKENALSREVARLTRELTDLGAVNLAALQELESASERKHFLDVQHEDLSRAISTLQDAIRRIDRETREQLLSTYDTVNKHFGELFPRLFGGGEAQLVLSGEEILDAGIQIVARPPGKKNASIHLLSGGEKALTAIALVFSMFQLNPAPFCMLDEVDAPLDDSNTERYCEMVKHMSAITQFVFISHSKITMEMARQLVGVTMQEQGVSRVVEVDIDEAIKLAQPEAA